MTYGTAKPAELAELVTEQRLPGTDDLDRLSTVDLVALMSEQDALVPAAVAAAGPHIARAVDAIVERMHEGGRLIYIGAGSAGRIGILDASECGPTFGATHDEVLALIAGGAAAVSAAVEGAEDSTDSAVADLSRVGASSADAVVGISASGRTPYAVEAIRYARSVGSLTIGLACTVGSPLARASDLAIEVVVGPEFVAGSTRLKAGTAQKLVCNMISTLTMIRLGRTYGNLMVSMTATNAKLWSRAHRLVSIITGRGDDEVGRALLAAQGSVPTAVIMLLAGVAYEDARFLLQQASNNLRTAMASIPR
jgi:N-acetylmuramic acid 6-phosphate etherase